MARLKHFYCGACSAFWFQLTPPFDRCIVAKAVQPRNVLGFAGGQVYFVIFFNRDCISVYFYVRMSTRAFSQKSSLWHCERSVCMTL